MTWGYDLEELLITGSPDYLVKRPNEILNVIDGVT